MGISPVAVSKVVADLRYRKKDSHTVYVGYIRGVMRYCTIRVG